MDHGSCSTVPLGPAGPHSLHCVHSNYRVLPTTKFVTLVVLLYTLFAKPGSADTIDIIPTSAELSQWKSLSACVTGLGSTFAPDK